MNQKALSILEETLIRYPILKREEAHLIAAFEMIIETYRSGGKLLICGNGGSAADADHVVGELMKGFIKKRPLDAEVKKSLINADVDGEIVEKLQSGLPAINLSSHTSLLTATINDINGEFVYAQQVLGFGKPGDVFVGISTSGNSKNVLLAGKAAKALQLGTIGLTGDSGGMMTEHFDVTIRVPEKETYRVQELHLPVYHTLCAMIEEEFYKE